MLCGKRLTLLWALGVVVLGGQARGDQPTSGPQPPGTTTPLRGLYRVDSFVALDAAARKTLGASQRGFLEMMRSSVKGGSLVDVEQSLLFDGNTMTVRMALVLRGEDDKSLSWAHCEASGRVTWEGTTMVIPATVSTVSDSGVLGDTKTHVECSAHVDAGELQVKVDKKGVFLERGGISGKARIVLVRVDRVVDPEKRATEVARSK